MPVPDSPVSCRRQACINGANSLVLLSSPYLRLSSEDYENGTLWPICLPTSVHSQHEFLNGCRPLRHHHQRNACSHWPRRCLEEESSYPNGVYESMGVSRDIPSRKSVVCLLIALPVSYSSTKHFTTTQVIGGMLRYD